jgi:hypothetical protein
MNNMRQNEINAQGLVVGDPVKVLTHCKGTAYGTVAGFESAMLVQVRRASGAIETYHASRVKYFMSPYAVRNAAPR